MREGWIKHRLGDVISLEYGKPLPSDQRCPEKGVPAYGANGVKCYAVEAYWEYPSIIVGRKGTAGAVNLVDGGFWPLDVTYYVTFDDEEHDLKFLYYLLSRLDLPSLATGVKPGINRNSVYAIEQHFPPLPEQKRIVAILDEAFAGIDTAIANAEKNLANARDLFESYLNSVFSQRGVEWRKERFGDICGFVRGPFGGSLKKDCFVNNGYAVYEQQHAINNQFSNIRYFVDEEKFDEMVRFELKPNDLIMSCSGTMGRVAIAPEDLKRGIINQALLKLTPSGRIDPRYLKFWMSSANFVDEISKHSKGAAIKNVASVKVLKEIFVPIPNLTEQASVISELSTCYKCTDELAAIYQQKLTALAELKQSLLQKAFSGELTADAVDAEDSVEAALA